MSPETLAALLAARAAKRSVVLATRLSDGLQHVLPDSAAPPLLQAAAGAALAADASATAEVAGDAWFLHLHVPPYRLLIVGAVHIAQTLAPMAASTGFDVTVIDPRRGFASADRFPAIGLNHDWPDQALAELRPDARTALVTLSHDPKLDDPALDFCLRGDAFYIGSLGSRKSHAARLTRMAALGHQDAALARIRGPVGLAIGALTTAEIAVSILAELVAARRGAWNASRHSTLKPMKSGTVAGILLAAGRSSRMHGTNKLLIADKHGVTMVARSADALLACGAEPVVVVLGHDGDAIRAELGGRPVHFVNNPTYADGMASSLQAGLGALPGGAAATLICLADMPLVTASMMARLLAAYDPALDRLIVVPICRGQRGNPVLWDRRYFAEMRALSGDRGARALLERHAAQVVEVAFEDDAVLRDFDTADRLVAFTG